MLAQLLGVDVNRIGDYVFTDQSMDSLLQRMMEQAQMYDNENEKPTTRSTDYIVPGLILNLYPSSFYLCGDDLGLVGDQGWVRNN